MASESAGKLKEDSTDLDNDEMFLLDDGNEPNKRGIWHDLLGPSARASWRTSNDRPPQDLAQAQHDLIQESGRTSKQLKRDFGRILVSHRDLAKRRERERKRAKDTRIRQGSLAHKAEMSKDSTALPVLYGSDFALATLRQRLLPNYAVAYRVLMEAKSLTSGRNWKPQRIIDFGIGCGSASVAAMDVFDDSIEWIHGIDPSQSMRDCAECIIRDVSEEREKKPRFTGSEMLSTETTGAFDMVLFAYTANELPHAVSTLTAAAILWQKLHPNGLFVMIDPGTPDGFHSIRSVRSMLLDCCPPNNGDSALRGTDECHIIAPCTHNGNCPMERHTRKLRDAEKGSANNNEFDEWEDDEEDDDDDFDQDNEEWWSDHEEAKEKEKVQKLTVGSAGETDAFQSAFCSFLHVLPSGKPRAKGEKFSYLVAQKRIVERDAEKMTTTSEVGSPHFDIASVNIPQLLAETYRAGRRQSKEAQAESSTLHSELLAKAASIRTLYQQSDNPLSLDFLQEDENRASFGRIVRPPLKRGGHVLIDYCCDGDKKDDEAAGEDGAIVRHRVSKAFGSRVAPGQYTAARKARWGGFWPRDKKDS